MRIQQFVMVVSFITLWVLAIWEMKAYSVAVDKVDHQLTLYGNSEAGKPGRKSNLSTGAVLDRNSVQPVPV